MSATTDQIVEAPTRLTADDRTAIDTQLAHDVYWAARRAHRRYLGQLPVPRPPRSAYRLLERLEACRRPPEALEEIERDERDART